MCPKCNSKNYESLKSNLWQCKDCRHMWPDEVTLPTQVFTHAEMSRLATYRQAVQAGFYNEFPNVVRVAHPFRWTSHD